MVRGSHPADARAEGDRGAEAGGDRFLHPQYGVTVVQRGRKVDFVRSFFASYLFVGLSSERHARRWTGHLFDCENVISVLGVEEPMVLPGKMLQALADQLAGKADQTAQAKRRNAAARFHIGEIRRILNGPFASFTAQIEEVLVSGKLKGAVEIFGRMTPVEFEPDDLAAA